MIYHYLKKKGHIYFMSWNPSIHIWLWIKEDNFQLKIFAKEYGFGNMDKLEENMENLVKKWNKIPKNTWFNWKKKKWQGLFI